MCTVIEGGPARVMRGLVAALLAALLAAACIGLGMASEARAADGEGPEVMQVSDNVFEGELVRYPGPWQFQVGRSSIILVRDDELRTIANNPDQVMDLSMTFDKREASLRQICEQAQARGDRTLIVAFDHFFAQYRPGQHAPRELMPDMDEYIALIAKVSQFAGAYGLRLELSLLSPLEIGPAYRQRTGESGRWMHYRKGLRDPKTGAFSVQLWQQLSWANNKGRINLEDAGVRVFAYQEQRLGGGTGYRVVDPNAIVEITDVAQVEPWEGAVFASGDYTARRVRVHGAGRTEVGDLDRVLVVQMYRTPEMDYFSENALPFLKDLVDRYTDAGVELNGLYSDEMHIQQDWGYFSHHDNGEFCLRYVSEGFEQAFAAKYGAQYADFAKSLVYFVYGQEDGTPDLTAKAGVQHVFGATPEAVRETALFRARYYRFLQDGVVDLFTAAKRYAEQRQGRRLEARAHATWAESPTIDHWDTRGLHEAPRKYEYTPDFVWSCTVHQAAAACYDYFKWGDFLTGNGNDHAEGGWLDRNYWGLVIGCSTGILNEVPYSYAAHWGMPHEVHERRTALASVYGASGSPLFGLVQDMQHRDVDVLFLYPIDLVAVEERFGSWMTQYGYCNLVTAAKLLERGEAVNGAIEMAGRRFTTLVATFEPFPSQRLLDLMQRFVEGGGRLIWSGPPPVKTWEGDDALAAWSRLFGVTYAPRIDYGHPAPGRMVKFAGVLGAVAPQMILTDFLVDRVYPVAPQEGVEPVAFVDEWPVGAHRAVGAGTATFLGYRPRDDQAQSLGYDVRNWFEVLHALGAYGSTGAFADANDNTEFLSRTGDALACRFPNGTVAIAPHLRTYVETWPGGFGRNREEDARHMAENPPPPFTLDLQDYKVNGHTVTYSGQGPMAFRVDDAGALIAFAGGGVQVVIDGRTTVFADQPIGQLAWAPVLDERKVEGGALLQAMVYGQGTVRFPAPYLPERVKVFAQGDQPGSRGTEAPCRMEDSVLVIEVGPETAGRWLFAAPE